MRTAVLPSHITVSTNRRDVCHVVSVHIVAVEIRTAPWVITLAKVSRMFPEVQEVIMNVTF